MSLDRDLFKIKTMKKILKMKRAGTLAPAAFFPLGGTAFKYDDV